MQLHSDLSTRVNECFSIIPKRKKGELVLGFLNVILRLIKTIINRKL